MSVDPYSKFVTNWFMVNGLSIVCDSVRWVCDGLCIVIEMSYHSNFDVFSHSNI